MVNDDNEDDYNNNDNDGEERGLLWPSPKVRLTSVLPLTLVVCTLSANVIHTKSDTVSLPLCHYTSATVPLFYCHCATIVDATSVLYTNTSISSFDE